MYNMLILITVALGHFSLGTPVLRFCTSTFCPVDPCVIFMVSFAEACFSLTRFEQPSSREGMVWMMSKVTTFLGP